MNTPRCVKKLDSGEFKFDDIDRAKAAEILNGGEKQYFPRRSTASAWEKYNFPMLKSVVVKSSEESTEGSCSAWANGSE